MLNIKPKSGNQWDLVSLGEVLLRFDPGDERVHTARSFRVWEGGGEYNVARNLAKCFRLDTAIVTALADNQIGRLVEDLIRQGSVDVSQILWTPTDGISRTARNGIYFMERGFGTRPPTGCSDRGNTAVSQLTQGAIDWQAIFSNHGTRWFHSGGIFAGLSDTTADVAREAMSAARASGSIVSYDLNYRDSLWSDRGGRDAANELNRELLKHADVVFGVEGFDAGFASFSEDSFRRSASQMISQNPSLKLLATTLRDVRSASTHDLGGVCFANDQIIRGKDFERVQVLDRVGSGDAFAAGLIYGLLSARTPQHSLDLATASSALSLSSPGDALSATLNEIESVSSDTAKSTIR